MGRCAGPPHPRWHLRYRIVQSGPGTRTQSARRAIDEIARVLRPGGYLILTAPHIWGLHEIPHDYFRFTPYGLRHLAEKSGLTVHTTRALAGFWVTAGTRFCYYLARFERGPLIPFVRVGFFVIQLGALFLDRLHRVESEAWNFLLIAQKDSPHE